MAKVLRFAGRVLLGVAWAVMVGVMFIGMYIITMYLLQGVL